MIDGRNPTIMVWDNKNRNWEPETELKEMKNNQLFRFKDKNICGRTTTSPYLMQRGKDVWCIDFYCGSNKYIMVGNLNKNIVEVVS